MLDRQLVLALRDAFGATVDEIGRDHVGDQKKAGDSSGPDNNVQHGIHLRISARRLRHGYKGKVLARTQPTFHTTDG
jgi:hypothetical protein